MPSYSTCSQCGSTDLVSHTWTSGGTRYLDTWCIEGHALGYQRGTPYDAQLAAWQARRDDLIRQSFALAARKNIAPMYTALVPKISQADDMIAATYRAIKNLRAAPLTH